MYNRIRFFLVAALFVGVAFFMTKSTRISAQTMNEGITRDSVGSICYAIDNAGDNSGAEILRDSSGVPELDNAAERTNKLINWVCGWIGGIMALFGFIWAAMNQAGHNTESRNMGIIVGVIGVVIAFAPSIVKWILGK